MGFIAILETVIKLGIPMVVLSWVIFTWLYGGGDLDRDADRKSINKQVKKMKKSFKKKKDGGTSNYMVEKWMWFGSGFYGLAGLWTFAVIEFIDVFRVMVNPSLISESFDNGLVFAVVNLVVNQFSNLVKAFVWFSYWSDGRVIVSLLVAYVGYWIGVEVARRSEDLPMVQELLRKLNSLFPSRR